MYQHQHMPAAKPFMVDQPSFGGKFLPTHAQC